MSKFNKARTTTSSGFGPITSGKSPAGRTHEGAPGYRHDLKSELFLLAVSNMVGEDTFYESASVRDDRYAALAREVAVADPGWTAAFLRWLRGEANMRSASLVGAIESARAMVRAGIGGSRAIVTSVLQRADEPGEAVGYWLSRYGRSIPKPVKRGIADAAVRLYNERSLLKYDTAAHAVRFADVLELTHPSASAGKPWQADLFRVALERRHNRDALSVGDLRMLAANAALRAEAACWPDVLLDEKRLSEAGMTWEDALSLAGSGVDKARLWEAMVPSMGYMAQLRNLRNLDEAGVSDRVAARVAARLADRAEVAASRQLPFRFMSAYENAPTLRWGHALDTALSLSLRNLPALPGRSLVLVDTSASMTSTPLSKRSSVTPAKAAALFGVALASKLGSHNVDLVGFADGVFWHRMGRNDSVLRQVAKFTARTGEVGHGTDIAGALAAAYHMHDRVFVISDMQTMTADTSAAIPATVPLYGFNLGGYRPTAYPTGPNRHEFGGLTDATFRMIPLIEAGRRGDWPWV